MIPKGSLFVIEAPGKRPAILSLLAKIGAPPDVKVVATRGRLYDLPDDEFGVDLDTLSFAEKQYRDEGRCHYIRTLIDVASSVYLMTDGDEEGEWIARQVIELSPARTFIRAPLPAMTSKALKRCIESPAGFSDGLSAAAVARRITDRVIGYSYSERDFSQPSAGSVGRILTPSLLNLISAVDRGVIARTLKGSDGSTYEFSVPATSNAEENLATTRMIESLPEVVVVAGEPEDIPQPLPLDGPQALLAVCSALGLSPESASKTLQSLYENGEISYHRSDAYYLPADHVAGIKDRANQYGFLGFSCEVLEAQSGRWQRTPYSTGAHHAVIPLGPARPITRRSSSTEEDLILHLLSVRTILPGIDAQWTRTRGSLPATPDGALWLKAASMLRAPHSIASTQYHLPGRAPKSFLPYVDPLHIGERGTKNCSFSSEVAVLSMLIEHRLARPSTLSGHATGIAKKYLNANGQVNAVGRSALQRARYYCPQLLEPEALERAHQDLFGEGPLSEYERARNALLNLGIDIKSLQATPALHASDTRTPSRAPPGVGEAAPGKT